MKAARQMDCFVQVSVFYRLVHTFLAAWRWEILVPLHCIHIRAHRTASASDQSQMLQK